MYDSLDDPELPSTAPLKPQPLAKGLPIPPVVPLVAIVSILVGLAMGYGIAPKPDPAAPTPAVSASSVALLPSPTTSVQFPSVSPSAGPGVAPTDSPLASAEIPPPGGLSLSQALDALGASFGPRSEVISASMSRYPLVSKGWVWLIVVPYTAIYCAGGLPAPQASSVPAGPLAESPLFADCRSISTTEMVILDYATGEFLEDRIPAG